MGEKIDEKLAEKKPVAVNDAATPVVVSATKKSGRRFFRMFSAIFLSVLFFALLATGTVYAYVKSYSDRVYPGVYLGSYPLGGMTGQEVKDFITNLNNRLNKEGLTYVFNKDGEDKKINIDTDIVEGDNVIEVVSVNSGSVENEAMKAGRDAQGWRLYWNPLAMRLSHVRLDLPVNIENKNFTEMLKAGLAEFERIPRDAGIKVTSTEPIKYEIVPEQTGMVFDYDNILQTTFQKLSVFDLESIRIEQKTVLPKTEAGQLNNLESVIGRVLSYGDIVLTYIDPATAEIKTGRITADNIKNWLAPSVGDENNIWLLLNQEEVRKHLDNYKYVLDKPAEEAKFVMGAGEVTQFRSGATGQQLNIEKTLEEINRVMRDRNTGAIGATSTVSLIVDPAEPKLQLSDVNNLGITAIIGAGTSTFHDSHTNRIKNIAHAVERLNGTIIAPGEEFSSIRYAGPFTAENGYLPEEVIKGSQIKKEIGGGMCQIGTTLFRMAMNSGMPITERTNHSLVVGYYADPVNGNPGTDATLYEPILDFKFLNDTGGYLLLETKIDYKKQMLTFTLWGKPDGRSGYYTRPLVSKWISAGEPKNVYTADLKPGETKCQNAFRGAIASFTYIRFTSTTEKIERVFDSYYRPLAKMCMVGVDPATCPDMTNCVPDSTASSTAGSGGAAAGGSATGTASTTL